MNTAHFVAVLVLVAGITMGTFTEPGAADTKATAAGFHVLAADFHVHSFFGDGALPPWEIEAEARRRGLDVIALTNHQQVLAARLGAWLALRQAGPLVVVGEEITAPAYHLTALGVDRTIGWRLSAADAIAAVHAQGGVAIASHPFRSYWGAFDARAMEQLDGTEVAHPAMYAGARTAGELTEFWRRVQAHRPTVAAIGSSDFHYRAPIGLCRTYVVASDRSEPAVLDAIRRGRTVAYDAYGQAYGEAALVEVVERYRRSTSISPSRVERFARAVSVVATLGGLVAIVIL